MALSRVKTWISGEVLTASDLNSEFNSILNNPVSLISPLGGALDLDGYAITLDAAGVTSFQSTAACAWSFTTGAKAGAPGTTGSIANYSAQTFTDSATAGSGTAAAWTGFAIQRPTLAATNASVTTTDAATFYIPNAPAAGTNETITNAYALWVDDGKSRLDGDLTVGGVAAFTGMPTFTAGIGPAYIQNVGLTSTVAAKALTVALKTQALADASATDTIHIAFRNATLTTGGYVIRSVTAAASIVAPSGATIGFSAAATGYLYVYAIDNAGTVELAISGGNNFDESTVHSTTAIGTGSDSGAVLYSTSARTNVAIRYLGSLKIQTGAVAGEWDNEDTILHVGPNTVGSAWSTGDVKVTFKAVADNGWVLMNDGSIGSAASGATTRASADTEALYTLLWTNISDTWAPVSTGRGASAAADFAANKTLKLPRTLGRALAVSGAGSSLTSRALGEYLGSETHTLTTGEMPSHGHDFKFRNDGTAGGGVYAAFAAGSGTDNAFVMTATASVASSGSGGAHNNMPPESFMNVMVKL